MESAEFEWAEEDVPDTVVDFFEADIFPGADDGDVDPMGVPSNAAVGADVANLEAVRVFERRKLLGHGARGGLIDGRWSFLIEGFVRADVVKL